MEYTRNEIIRRYQRECGTYAIIPSTLGTCIIFVYIISVMCSNGRILL